MAFGAKTVATLIKDLEDASLDTLDISNNASFKMSPAENMQKLAEGIINHKGLKKLVCVNCDIEDKTCEVLADILSKNHTLEELNLEKNKISSDGAKKLAEGLTNNHGVKTLNLLQQVVKAFGDDCLTAFIDMYNNNVTITKIIWRLDSRKSFMLAKLQTRNNEIAKRQAAGKEFNDLLPDHLRAAPPDMSASGEERAQKAPPTKRSSIENIQPHLDELTKAMGDVTITDDAAVKEGEEGEGGYSAEAAPAAAA